MVHVVVGARAPQFVDAVKVNPQDAEAVKMVVRMTRCFGDRNARQQSLSGAERLELRGNTRSVAERFGKLAYVVRQALPQSATASAAYTLNM